MRVRAQLARALCAVWVVALASGCVSEAESEPTASKVPADRMSDDVFHSDEISLIGYAQSKLRADCMERNGYPQLNEAGVQEYPGTYEYLVPKAPDWATATDEQARRMGFGSNSRPEAARVFGREDGYSRADDDCRREAKDILGQESEKIVEQVAMFANAISGEVAEVLHYSGGAEAQELKGLYVPVMDCLERKGYRWSGQGERNLDAYGLFVQKGYHEGPEPERPEPAPGKITIVPAVPERQYVPAPEESDLAVAAAQCARRTGYGDKFFALTLRVTREAIGKHEAELTELTPKVEALAKKAAQLVGR